MCVGTQALANLLLRMNPLKVIGLAFKNSCDLTRCRILQQQLSVLYILDRRAAEWAGWGYGAVSVNIYHASSPELATYSWWQCFATAEESRTSLWPSNPLLNFINHKKTLSEGKDRNSLGVMWQQLWGPGSGLFCANSTVYQPCLPGLIRTVCPKVPSTFRSKYRMI